MMGKQAGLARPGDVRESGTPLGQIDENHSIDNVGNVPLCLPLPNLLSRHPASAECPFGEKTPEIWPQASPCGGATPETWPAYPTYCGTPKPSKPNGGAGDATPEVFPEYAPDFPRCEQALPNFGNMSTVNFHPGFFTAGFPMGPAWPNLQAGIAIDHAVFGQVAPVVSSSGKKSLSLPDQKSCTISTMEAASDSKANVAVRPVPSKQSMREIAPQRQSPDTNGTPCTAAVYVDLSTLREKGSVARMGARR
jgi:hypothetical protein